MATPARIRPLRFISLCVAILAATLSLGAETIDITLLTLNDVYEVTPLGDGSHGGLARVATLRKELLRANRNTFVLHAGDAVSPSAIGTARIDGQPLAGAQMIDVLNRVKIDYAVLGNHEFDLRKEPLLSRIQESQFRWLCANATLTDGTKLPGVDETAVFEVRGRRSARARIAVFGLTMDRGDGSYFRVESPLENARRIVDSLRGKADVIIALTHLSLQEDIEIATQIPAIDLIVGGHEHENVLLRRGPRLTPIAKADANALSVWIHRLRWDTRTRRLAIGSELRVIGPDLTVDVDVDRVAREWTHKAYLAFEADGFLPDEVIADTDVALDGSESAVRNRQTNLGSLIADGLRRAAPEAQLAIFNGGTIRIDDIIPPGPLRQYDVLRSLPFGGKVILVEMTGELLKRTLDQGEANRGRGSYLQRSGVTGSSSSGWLIAGDVLDVSKHYHVAVNDYLMTGNDQGLEFLTLANPGVISVAPKSEIRHAVIQEIRARWGK